MRWVPGTYLSVAFASVQTERRRFEPNWKMERGRRESQLFYIDRGGRETGRERGLPPVWRQWIWYEGAMGRHEFTMGAQPTYIIANTVYPIFSQIFGTCIALRAKISPIWPTSKGGVLVVW